MNVLARRIFIIALLANLFVAGSVLADVVISQVYGGGGATTGSPAYTNDYVELFNRGASSVTIEGYSLQYGSATGQFGSSAANIYTFPVGTTIGAGKYLTVKLGGAGTLGGTFSFDLTTGNLSMSAASGKVAFVNVATALGCGATATPCALPQANILDTVSWGTANNGEGGTSVNNGVALNNTQGGIRKSSGCTDTNNNNADFTVATTATGLVPRTASTPAASCSNAAPTITAPANPIASVLQDAAAFTVNLTGSDDLGVYSWSASAVTGISSVVVSAGQGTSSVTYTVTLTAGFSGTASFTASLSDTVNTAATQTVNITVTAAGGGNAAPTITAPADPIATVAQDAAPFNVIVAGQDDGAVYNWSAIPVAGITSVSVSAGQGTASVTYTVTLNAGFSGTATFTASLSDNVNPTVDATVNITVTPPPPPANHVTISQLYGGGGNSGATLTNDFIELYNPTLSSVDMAGWSVQYASATGSFTQIQPIGGVIAPGEYFLIGLASGGAVGSPLPEPNISGIFNMSATAGKVALVSNGISLDGTACGTWIADGDLVDLVGYGTTANCSEGSSNAPAASNTTSLFRKNGGSTDTNVNSADFTAATPAPRRTSPLQEIGPAILSTDPSSGNTIAPRDASLVITFTELVDVSTGWYTINCTTTGNHDFATIAEGAPGSWVITPNVNFLAGETCTATIFKDFVSDRDLDDSAPNTDLLPADYTWSFSIATGTAPAYPMDVHLTMGNPSDAMFDELTPDNFLMEKPEFTLSYNRSRGGPNWVSWHLAEEWVGSLTRIDIFRPDPAVPPAWYRVLGSDFSGSGFDRGHVVPNADRYSSRPINQATFLMTNIIPQAPDNNQGPWNDMEGDLRLLLPANELYIVAGGAGTGGVGSNGAASSVANGQVAVPAYTWKVVMVLPKASGDDVARVTAATRTIAVIMPNINGIGANLWTSYLTSVDAVEALTGYDFFSEVPDAIENSIEAGVNGVNPPGAANVSIILNEDGSLAVPLDGTSPSGAELAYLIVTPPASGGLSGSDSNPTYTPLPDFNGNDTFTYKVNDGTGDSNTATVAITVREVNDPPTATNDSASTNAYTPLLFPAANLTLNDSAGPANEAAQTLTVTSVTPTVNTFGTVTLDAGQVTYTPAFGFSGNASFTYTVCDNGTTAGLADSLCTTGTVNLTVVPPVAARFGVSAPASVTAGEPFTVTVVALDAWNNPMPGYTGTVHFTSSSSGTLPSDYTFTGADGGQRTFNVVLTTLGAQTVSVDDGSLTGISPMILVGDVEAPACPDGNLCMQDGRFEISVSARDQRTGNSAEGVPVQQNGQFGFFALPTLTGSMDNPEIFVKILDGRPINGNFWVFYGGLTDLEYTITIFDKEAGVTKTYTKPAGSSSGGFDVGGGVTPEACVGEVDGTALAPVTPATCTPGADALCLTSSRFRVEVDARDQRTGNTGEGLAIPQGDLFGYFALPALTGDVTNPEVFVKVLDGRGVNGHFWVFFAGLTDLEYTVTVTDSVTGIVKTYTKAPGSACGAFDTDAF